VAVAERGQAIERSGECRRCATFCDKLVEPRDCLAMRCPFLWSYVDGPTGRRYMGCMQRVFRAEIHIALFEAAERNGGFGGIKVTGEPLPHCQTRVEPAFEGDGPEHACVNPEFFACEEQAKQLDLRDGLRAA
jgi:hypothetical protein